MQVRFTERPSGTHDIELCGFAHDFLEEFHGLRRLDAEKLAEEEIFPAGVVGQGVVLRAKDDFVRISRLAFVARAGSRCSCVWHQHWSFQIHQDVGSGA